ncbi:helix-turn-helix domain-containing protein [Ensifer soli]|uniref:helix-turn-helix domain-containing protein n=1 Tax=Ciceribacter sp. sgz301302 TaxID=3342379 RepID=UPI0035B95B4D
MENRTDIAIGDRLHRLRVEAGLTLDGLAEGSGVSRAMISRIERGEASPTAQLLARLCTALGQSLSTFFAGETPSAERLARRETQPEWRDPATGYLRRAVSPPGLPTPVDVVEVEFPEGATVGFPPATAGARMSQHVWLLSGRLLMTVGTGAPVAMAPGDCLFMTFAEGHIFHNPGPGPARYAVILNRNRS